MSGISSGPTTGGSFTDIAGSVRAPVLGTPVYKTITNATTAFDADLAAGEHLLYAYQTAVCFRLNAAGVTTAAVWATVPAILLEPGTYFPIKLNAAARVVAIAQNAGESVTMMAVPVS